MFCKYCGNELPEGANFCPKCGRINEVVNHEEEHVRVDMGFNPDSSGAPYTPPFNPSAVNEAEKDELSGGILKFAIMGLAFGASGYLSILGIIFSIVSKSKLNAYCAKFGEPEGRARVGKALGIAGLAVSISFTALFALLFSLGILIGIAAAL